MVITWACGHFLARGLWSCPGWVCRHLLGLWSFSGSWAVVMSCCGLWRACCLLADQNLKFNLSTLEIRLKRSQRFRSVCRRAAHAGLTARQHLERGWDASSVAPSPNSFTGRPLKNCAGQTPLCTMCCKLLESTKSLRWPCGIDTVKSR